MYSGYSKNEIINLRPKSDRKLQESWKMRLQMETTEQERTIIDLYPEGRMKLDVPRMKDWNRGFWNAVSPEEPLESIFDYWIHSRRHRRKRWKTKRVDAILRYPIRGRVQALRPIQYKRWQGAECEGGAFAGVRNYNRLTYKSANSFRRPLKQQKPEPPAL